MTAIEVQKQKEVLRPLRVLIPLIKDDLRKGAEAANEAGMPYYRAAGEKMLEAKPQMPHGRFLTWIKDNFGVRHRQAQIYMSYATASMQKRTPAYTSMDDFRRRHLGEERIPGSQRDKPLIEPIKEAINRATHIRNLHEESLKRAEERDIERRLALQLIDIGYKALATKFHPDRGGSRDAMQRLNRVRDRLKASA